MAFDSYSDPRINIHPSCDVTDSTEIIVSHGTQRVDIGAGCRIHGKIELMGQNTRLIIGEGARFEGHVFIVLREAGDTITIGKDCLLSSCVFRSSDGHPIYSRETGKRINPSADIVIGDRNWIGERAMIQKGARTPSGCVIAAGSIVSRLPQGIPANCILSGNPAQPVTFDIEWRKEFGDPPEI